MLEESVGRSWPGALELAPTRLTEGRFRSMVERRVAGEPLQYVLGHWSFRNLDLMVDRRVLIPRPETEIVVEVALQELDLLRVEGRPPVAVDLGTGSGAIALALASERLGTEVWATDRSAEALDVASANLAGLGGRAATQVRLVRGDWWGALPADLTGAVDLVVSNPPYIAQHELADLDPVVSDWEPAGALVSGPSGLEDVHTILAGARPWLRPQATVVIELAPHQAETAVALAGAAGFHEVMVRKDLTGRQRALVARLRPTE
jgi:release factor glutamine methyltransferase